MKAKIPRFLSDLSPSEVKKLEDIVENQINHEEAELQKIWLQMLCAVLHRTCGFGESRCLRVLGGWRRMYWKNARIAGKKEQEEWLAEELKFFKNGFPKEYVDSMER